MSASISDFDFSQPVFIMLLPLPDLLNTNELSQAHLLLETAHWSDGRASAGVQAMLVKNNQQLPHDSEAAHTVRQLVLNALDRHPQFFSAVLPKRVYTPTINRYTGGSNHYGQHVDNAIRFAPDSGQRVRTDISCTVFLSDPSTYEGGELVIHEAHGNQLVKLPAGHAVIYPGTHVHQVLPVTSGERLACFFWIESMVRSPEQRRLLYDMDLALTQLRQTHGDDPTTVALTGTYHNLLRMWADA